MLLFERIKKKFLRLRHITYRLTSLIKKYILLLSQHGPRKTVEQFFLKLFPTLTSNNLSIQHLENQTKTLEQQIRQQNEAITFLTEWNKKITLNTVHTSSKSTFISIIMPTFNRSFIIKQAIDSVLAQTYSHWELIIIDDGSTDNTQEIIRTYRDARIRYIYQDHQGVSAARNQGLEKSQGEIIAYLDTDNTWYPYFLSVAIQEFQAHPEYQSIHTGYAIYDTSNNIKHIAGKLFDASALKESNYIDLNTFLHRRQLYQEKGGFDTNLTRLVDWDLILRYTNDTPSYLLPILSTHYQEGDWPRVTTQEPFSYNFSLIRRKNQSAPTHTAHVLYVLWHYPHLSESYVQTEIEYMQQRGIKIEVWSELEKTPAPYPIHVPLHHGSLAETIKKVQPDLIHIHWLYSAKEYRDVLAEANIPITVRAHGFDVSQQLLDELTSQPWLTRVYLFPHVKERMLDHSRIQPINVAFNPNLFYPNYNKDTRLVIRTAAAIPTKDLPIFIDTAKQFPKHKFILILVTAAKLEYFIEQIQDYNNKAGNPVELHINMQRSDLAEVMRLAGIYFHTHGIQAPFGMPISIAESMATGCYPIVRNLPGAQQYIRHCGSIYNDPSEASKAIQATEEWSNAQWKKAQVAAIDFAYAHYVDHVALEPLLQDWIALTKKKEAPEIIAQDNLILADGP